MNSAETMEIQIREKLKEGELICVSPEEENFLDHTEFSKILINNLKIAETSKFLSGYNNYIIGSDSEAYPLLECQ
jgi:hypothetical protein